MDNMKLDLLKYVIILFKSLKLLERTPFFLNWLQYLYIKLTNQYMGCNETIFTKHSQFLLSYMSILNLKHQQ